jgi:DNA invertase Pin-like site-specific DNA recombinase
LPRQRTAIKEYAAKHGIKIVQVCEERRVTGTKELIDRPELSVLIVALHSDGIKVVLIEALNRVACDLLVQESIMADFKCHAFEIISVAESDLCSEDPTRKLIRQIRSAFSEYEKTMIVLKLRGARQRMKIRTARCEGAKPYGSFAGEQVVMERITALRAEGESFDAIASILDREGHRPRRGARWYGSAVNKTCSRQAS